jgi:hypothetical protein
VVTHIQIKAARKEPMVTQTSLRFSTNGIAGGARCNPLRQVLILPSSSLTEFNLSPGDLRENLVVKYDLLHDLPSGTVFAIGSAQVRLTFHCEPCKQIKDKVAIAQIQHKRGYFGQFLNSGTIHIGDDVRNLGAFHEPIPYGVKDRLHWFLLRQPQPVTIAKLLFECGLPTFYARAIPGMIKHFPDQLKMKVRRKA